MRSNMKKRERQDYVLSRARELALTGDYDGWQRIEFHLRFVEGFSEARGWLDSRFTRDELDRLCAQSHNKRRENA